jgi:hypothetical protein
MVPNNQRQEWSTHVNLPQVKRVEVIDHRPPHQSDAIDQPRGRVLSLLDVNDVELSIQDDGLTLKIFVG